jgi:hypothetical protein
MFIKLFAALAVAGLLTACGGGGDSGGGGVIAGSAIAQPPATEPPPAPAAPTTAGCHVVIFGDSLIADPWLTETVPASIARQRPTWTVDNRAVGGQTAFEGATKYLGVSLPPGSKVVVEWGLNDLILGNDSSQQLSTFVSRLIADGNTAVLTGIIQYPKAGSKWDYLNSLWLTVATSDGAAFASWGEVPITTFDGEHPDQPSTNALVEDLLNTLDKECPL